MSNPGHHYDAVGVLLGQHSRDGQEVRDTPVKTQDETKNPSTLVKGRQLRGGGDCESLRLPPLTLLPSHICPCQLLRQRRRRLSGWCHHSSPRRRPPRPLLTRKEGGQTAAPAEKVFKKVSPPKELSLKEQAIAQATAACTKEETLAAKRRALQVDNGDLKWKKAWRPLDLLEKQRKEASASKEDIRVMHPPGCNQGQGALKRRRHIGSNIPQGASAK